MPQQKIIEETKERALVAVVNWRAADKVAFTNKADRDAQRTEYRERNNLRAAADDLTGSAQP
jgi:hypothetical protein